MLGESLAKVFTGEQERRQEFFCFFVFVFVFFLRVDTLEEPFLRERRKGARGGGEVAEWG